MAESEVRRNRLRSLLTQPRLSADVISCAIREGPGLGLSWMVNLSRRNRMRRDLSDEPLVLEEGPLSALCLASCARRSRWDLRATLPKLTTGHTVVILELDPETVVTRIRKRGGFLHQEPQTQLWDLVDRYLNALEIVAEAVPAPVLRYRADRSPKELAAQIDSDLRAQGL